mmetsp:Transcript_29094/g.43977  ORF Transcript_29094/g.43977 Transcript_29094/m.43977 type:complete len:494 (-) Transcript_29094:74-1555(-)
MMLARSSNDKNPTYSKKRTLDDRCEEDDLNSSREGSESMSLSTPMRKTQRGPEETNSPGMSCVSRDGMPQKYQKKSYAPMIDTDSPSSYPKHVIVPSPPHSNEQRGHGVRPRHSGHNGHYIEDSPEVKKTGEQVGTPTLSHESRQHRGYDGPPYRPQGGGGYHRGGDSNGYYRGHEMDMCTPYSHHGQKVNLNPKRWACDYCCTATFSSYEEACAHEAECAGRQGLGPRQRPYPNYGPSNHNYNARQPNGGLGTLYQATQEVHQNSPRMPPNPHYDNQYYHSPPPPPPPPSHHYPHGHWGPPMPTESNGYPSLSPRFQEFRRYDEPPDRAYHGYQQKNQHRMLLSMPADADSLSDRQCYVRSDFVEVFAATDKDVAARHSKGAQKLVLGQVGIRCIHCAHLRPKDRAERAVCYPSSISRIYQTVADMQRFHFEQCREIPDETRKVYKSLKTTRPRGVGSPQTYWVQSAKLLNLVDSDNGIRFGNSESNSSETS